MNILIVDDSRTIRKLLSDTLEAVGHTVCQAKDGIDALEKLEKFSPETIITDLNMPRMNGIELVKKLRHINKTKFLPILFLTTEGSSEMKEKGRQAGATGWLVKPFDKNSLLNTIERVSS
ncbi:response regulator [Gluconobacter japonicus]|uniref:Response regulator n=1 Tax=Gluconobacter japonicus TaxID=376620 RepID=A0ABQ5WKS1_GLUJA|nr:response regulator [Gluconobacter japonicus]KXV26641.1 chemotaxis protein CheY [Gluconobacter japonicus]GBR24130.1 chemotaxis protein CheY [Gluconobacter japonicus NBRC 3271]GLQ60583.1 response regulator [Gluconobacter japonicus]